MFRYRIGVSSSSIRNRSDIPSPGRSVKYLLYILRVVQTLKGVVFNVFQPLRYLHCTYHPMYFHHSEIDTFSESIFITVYRRGLTLGLKTLHPFPHRFGGERMKDFETQSQINCFIAAINI